MVKSTLINIWRRKKNFSLVLFQHVLSRNIRYLNFLFNIIFDLSTLYDMIMMLFEIISISNVYHTESYLEIAAIVIIMNDKKRILVVL